MFSKLKRFLNYRLPYYQKQIAGIHDLKMLQGRQLSWQVSAKTPKSIHEVEFSIYSQCGDDGIIQYLVSRLPIANKTFVEFGVENYLEANTRFLLMNNNWSGLIMDGSAKNIEFIKNDKFYWQYDLKAQEAFITAENINDLLEANNITGSLGLLHIDIDGNDYWVWKAINIVDPDIVIMEYNSIFGKDHAWTTPYQADFVRGNAHYSNLYFGSSLKALCMEAEARNMAFIGCNSAGNNAYFVKKEYLDHLSVRALTCEEGYVASKFREGRNEDGSLSFVSGKQRLKVIEGLPVWNVETEQMEKIKA